VQIKGSKYTISGGKNRTFINFFIFNHVRIGCLPCLLRLLALFLAGKCTSTQLVHHQLHLLCLRCLHVIKEIFYFENPIKEVLDVEMTIKTRPVNFYPKIMGVFRSSSTANFLPEVVVFLT
jgi:hypothetical protein